MHAEDNGDREDNSRRIGTIRPIANDSDVFVGENVMHGQHQANTWHVVTGVEDPEDDASPIGYREQRI